MNHRYVKYVLSVIIHVIEFGIIKFIWHFKISFSDSSLYISASCFIRLKQFLFFAFRFSQTITELVVR